MMALRLCFKVRTSQDCQIYEFTWPHTMVLYPTDMNSYVNFSEKYHYIFSRPRKTEGEVRTKENLSSGSFLSLHCSAAAWSCQKETSHFQFTHTHTKLNTPTLQAYLYSAALLVFHWSRSDSLCAVAHSHSRRLNNVCFYPSHKQNTEEPPATKGNKVAVMWED